MSRTSHFTKETLEVLVEKAETLKGTLDNNAQNHNIISGLVTEVSVGVITIAINKTSVLLLGSTLLSNPMLLGIYVTSGMLGMYYPKIRAFFQRHDLYRKYGVISDHIDHVIGIAKEMDNNNK